MEPPNFPQPPPNILPPLTPLNMTLPHSPPPAQEPPPHPSLSSSSLYSSSDDEEPPPPPPPSLSSSAAAASSSDDEEPPPPNSFPSKSLLISFSIILVVLGFVIGRSTFKKK